LEQEMMVKFATGERTNQTLDRKLDPAAAEDGPDRRRERLFAFDDF
jgi:hypothetical protein